MPCSEGFHWAGHKCDEVVKGQVESVTWAQTGAVATLQSWIDFTVHYRSPAGDSSNPETCTKLWHGQKLDQICLLKMS